MTVLAQRKIYGPGAIVGAGVIVGDGVGPVGAGVIVGDGVGPVGDGVGVGTGDVWACAGSSTLSTTGLCHFC
jgi:hypothetical protein